MLGFPKQDALRVILSVKSYIYTLVAPPPSIGRFIKEPEDAEIALKAIRSRKEGNYYEFALVTHRVNGRDG